MTAFCVKGKQFQFKRLPFGTANSSAIFQKVINEVLSDLVLTDDVHSYVDDIVVAVDDFESLLERCAEVIDRLWKAEFKLCPKKCSIGMKEVCVLGHFLSEKGIRPNPEKVKAIEMMSPPRNMKDLQSLFGLTSYFRK